MRTYKKELEIIASDFLEQSGEKPNFTNRDFMNAVIIFQTALMDKMFDLMSDEKILTKHGENMAESCGSSLRQLIKTYTGLDTHDVEKFV